MPVTDCNGDQDRDRGRPVLFVRPMRVVPVTSSNLAILIFFVAASATEYVLYNCCVELRGAPSIYLPTCTCSGQRTTI